MPVAENSMDPVLHPGRISESTSAGGFDPLVVSLSKWLTIVVSSHGFLAS